MIKKVQMAINEGHEVGFYPSALRSFQGIGDYPQFRFYDSLREACECSCKVVVIVSPFREQWCQGNKKILHIVPRNIYIGIGCHEGVTAQEIQKAVRQVCRHLLLHEASIAAICTVDRRKHEQGLIEFCRKKDIPLRTFNVHTIQSVQFQCHSSVSSSALRALGIAGVAEPCAFLGSQKGELLLAKRTVGNVTIAVAQKRIYDLITESEDAYDEANR